MKRIELDTFTRAFLTCIFWTWDTNAPGGDYLKTGRAEKLLARTPGKELEKAVKFCQKFQALPGVGADLARAGLDTDQAGYDLALSCNGHGAGFFDRIPDTCEKIDGYCLCAYHSAQRLQKSAQFMGFFEADRYKGRHYFYCHLD